MLALSLSFLALQARRGGGYNPGPTEPEQPFDGYYIDDNSNRYTDDAGNIFIIQVPGTVSYYTDDQGNVYTDDQGNVFFVDENGQIVFYTDDNGNIYTDDAGNIYIT